MIVKPFASCKERFILIDFREIRHAAAKIDLSDRMPGPGCLFSDWHICLSIFPGSRIFFHFFIIVRFRSPVIDKILKEFPVLFFFGQTIEFCQSKFDLFVSGPAAAFAFLKTENGAEIR